MRCEECQTEPLTPGHYCECCGRKLSLQERGEVATAVNMPVHAEPVAALVEAWLPPVEPEPVPAVAAPPAARCESCGGPAEEGDLCAACQRAFHAVLETTRVATPSADSIAEVPEIVPVDAPVLTAPSAPPDIPDAESFVEIALPPPVHPVIEVTAAPAPKAAPTGPMPEAPQPTPRSARPIVAAQSQPPGRSRSIGMAAAAFVIVAVIGFPLGTYWLGRQELITVPSADQPADTASPATAIDRAPASPSVVAAATPTPPVKVVDLSSAPPKANTLVPPARGVPARVLPKGARQPTTSVRQASVTTPGPATPAPVVEAAPPAPEPAPEPPAREAPAAPVGPFFEARQVDQSPGVASRVEPRVPDDLRAVNDVVVVRVLVSQSGHPSIVSLLRRSKVGPTLDDAVVAAVKQWTFSPARKRGEAVSCWYNVGVPISGTE